MSRSQRASAMVFQDERCRERRRASVASWIRRSSSSCRSRSFSPISLSGFVGGVDCSYVLRDKRDGRDSTPESLGKELHKGVGEEGHAAGIGMVDGIEHQGGVRNPLPPEPAVAEARIGQGDAVLLAEGAEA